VNFWQTEPVARVRHRQSFRSGRQAFVRLTPAGKGISKSSKQTLQRKPGTHCAQLGGATAHLRNALGWLAWCASA
jgi:hypothetical protein